MANYISAVTISAITLADRTFTALATRDTQDIRFKGGYNEADSADIYLGFYETAADHETSINIRDTAAVYKWTLSDSAESGTGEYYADLTAGGDPSLISPDWVEEGGTQMVNGTLGSLTASQWGYGDNDTLGYSTVYVRQDDDADPDGEADNHIEHIMVTDQMIKAAAGQPFQNNVLELFLTPFWVFQKTGAELAANTVKILKGK